MRRHASWTNPTKFSRGHSHGNTDSSAKTMPSETCSGSFRHRERVPRSPCPALRALAQQSRATRPTAHSAVSPPSRQPRPRPEELNRRLLFPLRRDFPECGTHRHKIWCAPSPQIVHFPRSAAGTRGAPDLGNPVHPERRKSLLKHLRKDGQFGAIGGSLRHEPASPLNVLVASCGPAVHIDQGDAHGCYCNEHGAKAIPISALQRGPKCASWSRRSLS